jgi:hypothetical protein
MKLSREEIHIISRNSNLSQESVEKILNENIYSERNHWKRFLRLFFISLGIGFTTAGVIFFFAYNWADMHKFTKLAL